MPRKDAVAPAQASLSTGTDRQVVANLSQVVNTQINRVPLTI